MCKINLKADKTAIRTPVPNIGHRKQDTECGVQLLIALLSVGFARAFSDSEGLA